MKVRTIDVRAGDKWIFPGDIHFDQHDGPALRVMSRLMAGEAVNGMCLMGDTHNSIGVSRHATLRSARHYRGGKATLKAEKEAALPFFTTWRSLIEGQRRKSRPGGLEVIEGNHEKWWAGVQDEYPGLLDTEWPELYGDLYDGWHVNGDTTALKFGPLLVVHGHRVRGSLSRMSASSVLRNYPGQNTLYGHTHRIDSCTTPTSKNGVPVTHGAWTMGHMRNREQELDDPNIGQFAERHEQGVALVSFFNLDSVLGFNVELVRVHRTLPTDQPVMVVNGRVYS